MLRGFICRILLAAGLIIGFTINPGDALEGGKVVPAGSGHTVPTGPGTGSYQRSFSVADGLAYPFVHSMVQDRKGNFWFATRGGVSRYDGGTIETFTVENGLMGNYIISIYLDREDHIWLGTLSHGVTRFDGKTFTHFTQEDGLAGNGVRAIVQDRKGDFWFATYEGINRYDGNKWTTFTSWDGLPEERFVSICEDQRANPINANTMGGIIKDAGLTIEAFKALL